MGWRGYKYKGSKFTFKKRRDAARDFDRLTQGIGRAVGRGTRALGRALKRSSRRRKQGCCCCPVAALVIASPFFIVALALMFF